MNIKNYLYDWTERVRERIAFKIFPEFNMYITAIQRMAETEENLRCIDALENADSVCADWAIETIKIKYLTWEEIKDKYGL
jgi:hypothetical protein